jgi:hypothetical protein
LVMRFIANWRPVVSSEACTDIVKVTKDFG